MIAALLLTVALAASSAAAAAVWKPGFLLTNREDGQKDFLRVLSPEGVLVEDVLVSGADLWDVQDDIAAVAAAADGRHAFLVSSYSHNLYAIQLTNPHTVSWLTTLPESIMKQAVSTVDSLALDPSGRLYTGVSTGCDDEDPSAKCSGSYVVRHTLDTTPGTAVMPIKADAFRFASAGLSVSSDGGLLFGMERPVAQGTAA
eukprot:CAMPEP_0206143402 /NCGR_PEP_ID=MMETSP1473-20131121/20449_1 /ASSEMBLY_ACC=CAM_ASM_001109 /TAXON_ID=1461547 /ORGANISM="Stichococcus sp, Strain RCC1054" /LENGTH=200 /DNA_ID=CAMNT_0053538789 /DNA_START=296 /DNA_END=895 /DNA_ORIENTATION=-